MKKTVSIIGGGSAALMLACELDPQKFSVSIYERNAALARKFLVAGDGGLNITHSEAKEKFIQRYTPSSFLEKAFDHFSNQDLVKWFHQFGVDTFVGSSGRVFPVKGMKPAEVLSLITEKLKSKNVSVHYRYTWKGFSNNGSLLFENNCREHTIQSDIVVFSLGGASWPVTGSKGEWLQYFTSKRIEVNEFNASNCAFKVNWPAELVNKIEGKALKNILVRCSGKEILGEVVLTRLGIEGSGVYPLSPEIRAELKANQQAELTVDFKPGLSEEKIFLKLKQSRAPLSTALKEALHLTSAAVHLLKAFIPRNEFLDLHRLSSYIKNFKIDICAAGPIDDAISTTGGIALREIDENFELKKLQSHFAIGEMLDYDAPTGGYLLQSCFSMGKYLADFLNNTTI